MKIIIDGVKIGRFLFSQVALNQFAFFATDYTDFHRRKTEVLIFRR